MVFLSGIKIRRIFKGLEMNGKRKIICGDVAIGGDAPISIQSMTNVDTANIKEVTAQITRLEEAGCEIIRVAVPDMASAEAIKIIKKTMKVPLVADIHFDYRLAIKSMAMGADKIRINPGNIGKRENVEKVVKEAKSRQIPIRIGVNSGSLEKDIVKKYGGVTAEGLVLSAKRNIQLLEDLDFDNIVVSIKSSNPKMNYDAHKMLWEDVKYPLHIGVTESGTTESGKVKSAVGIGALLLAGIGNTMRVSLTGDPVEEVLLAQEILKATGKRAQGIELVSCPTCGRTKINLEKIALQVEKAIKPIECERAKKGLKPIKVAVMGCVVNGPGEAKEADFGIAGGDGKAVIFQKGEVLKTVEEEKVLEEFLALIRAYK